MTKKGIELLETTTKTPARGGGFCILGKSYIIGYCAVFINVYNSRSFNVQGGLASFLRIGFDFEIASVYY